eukprot:CAMPEP_0201665306 /NCGR_PEP_ID=MMETSP0494-20130426/6490_1 /ASSEMBLY_ACC=CAM_ASM_000839 /TAXON_ID=420259 /ORGANISM="Thalassiosira gravida, Strain GMp14c1" /LENGTH=305 /DNA_ID=CAMNT_0048144233 /DNA_START=44 /DNA_END=961 /DNA_ORIENTATION=+
MCVSVYQEPPHYPVKDSSNLDDSCGTLDSEIDSLDGVQASSPSVRMCDVDGDVTHPLTEQQEPYFYNILIKDSIEVQKDLPVNDDELHEENPHLEDYLIPHHRVHIESPEELNVAEEVLSAKNECCTEEASQEATSPEEEVSTKDECCSPESEAASEITASQPQEQAKKPKRKVSFGTVLVRDYDLILGDHPCCSYGPPVTISWDYLEYEPVDLNLYEFHHPPRRNLREMCLNYYHRMKILTLAGYTEAELKLSKKDLKRAQRNRSITKSIVVHYPLFKAEDAVESAGRKFTRLLKTGSFRSIST